MREGPRRSNWLQPEEAAAYLGVAVGTIRNLTSAGRLPFGRRGRIVRYRSEDLDQWLLGGDGRSASASEAGRWAVADGCTPRADDEWRADSPRGANHE